MRYETFDLAPWKVYTVVKIGKTRVGFYTDLDRAVYGLSAWRVR